MNWTLYIKPVVIILIAIVLSIDSYHSINRFIIYSVGIMLLVAGIFSAVVTYFKIKTFEFEVTNKRVLIKHRILRTQSFEIMLNKVESIYVGQNISDRIVTVELL